MDVMVMHEFGRFMFEEGTSCHTAADSERRLGRLLTCKLSDLSEEATGLLLLLRLLSGSSLGRRVRRRRRWSVCSARVIPLGDARGRVEVEPRGWMLEHVLTGVDWAYLRMKSKHRAASNQTI